MENDVEVAALHERPDVNLPDRELLLLHGPLREIDRQPHVAVGSLLFKDPPRGTGDKGRGSGQCGKEKRKKEKKKKRERGTTELRFIEV